MVNQDLLAFKKTFAGEFLLDTTSLAVYATDASHYQVRPLGIAIPRNEAEVKTIVTFAHQHQIPILPRGAATSLAGQTVNQAIVIDFTKYFSSIVSINQVEQYAIVQPGLSRDALNAACQPMGLHFAPDPATSSRASFGGMIANNSSGTRSILYGKTIDHVLSLKVMLTDGTVLELDEKSQQRYDDICHQNSREADIYRGFRSIIFENTEEIKQRFPKVMRRVSGYALDEFVYTDHWNLAKLVCGSEGTLGLILEAKVKLTPLPKVQSMVIVHFDDKLEAIAAVKHFNTFGPAAVEMIDDYILDMSKKNAITRRYYDKIVKGEPAAIMTIEFYADTLAELLQKSQQLEAYLATNPSAYAHQVVQDKATINDALALRKEGLGLMMGVYTKEKPSEFIEDMAIPVEDLAAYIQELNAFCDTLKVKNVLYAHASVGVLHVKPILDLMTKEGLDKMQQICDKVFELVMKYKGSWSGEHGDGRVRSPKLREFFGDQLYSAFRQVKQLFDPNGIMNPNIILDPHPMVSDFRYGENYQEEAITDTVYKYRNGPNFNQMVHLCSGIGACRNLSGGTMCPSFRASLEEKDSTRGRANMLRLALAGEMGLQDITEDAVIDVLDLCLSCKACKTECPSNVDMAKLKSEVLQRKYDRKGVQWSEKIVLYSATMSKWCSGWLAPIVNFTLRQSLVKQLLHRFGGISKERNLPTYAKQSLDHWYTNPSSSNTKPTVVLFADTYINYHETTLGKHAIGLLTALGYDVQLASVGCCQRPKISNGFLKSAKEKGTVMAEKLRPYIDKGYKILTIEPSCYTALVDDLPDLLDDATLGQQMKAAIMPIEVFIADLVDPTLLQKTLKLRDAEVVLHGHCHQKASYGTTAIKKIVSVLGGNCQELDAGCCGMAGAFGYEVHHFDMSKTIAQKGILSMLPTDKAAIMSNGYSCRHQLADFSTTKGEHCIMFVEKR